MTPDPAQLLRLADAVLATHGPDRRLDVLVWNQLGWTEGLDEAIAWRNHLHLGPEMIVNGTTLADAIERYPSDMAGLGRSWNIPRATASHDAVELLLGTPELPFVWNLTIDFGGLRRARVTDGTIAAVRTAATPTLALLSAMLEASARRVGAGLPLSERA